MSTGPRVPKIRLQFIILVDLFVHRGEIGHGQFPGDVEEGRLQSGDVDIIRVEDELGPLEIVP